MHMNRPPAPAFIPVSRFAPVPLQRPLKYFGRKFQVHISSPLTFSPATVLQAAFGFSLQQFIKADKRGAAMALRDLWRGVTKKNRLSATTRKRIVRELPRLFTAETMDSLLSGEEPREEPELGFDWEILLLTIGSGSSDESYQIVKEAARFDAAMRTAREVAVKDPEKASGLLTPLQKCMLEGWEGSRLDPRVALLIEVSLLVWARVEVRRARACSNAPPHELNLLKLLATDRKPLGHWLAAMGQAVGCKTLPELSRQMALKNIRRHRYLVSYDLLKKWSGGVQLMPLHGADCVIRAVGSRIERTHAQQAFALARWGSFLCELVIAGTYGSPPTWRAAQDQLYQRYTAIRAKRSIPALRSRPRR